MFLAPWLCNAGCEVDEADSAVLDGETPDLSASEFETDEDSAVDPDARPELAPGAMSARDAGGEFVPLEAIVKFRTPTPDRPRADLAGAASSETLARGIHLLRLDAGQRSGLAATDPVGATWAWIEELQADPEVEYAHPNWLFELSLTPNDQRYPAQWQYPQIKLPTAWDLTTGASTVRIAVIDTGRTSHEDLVGRWVPGVEYDAYREDGDASARAGLVWNHGVAVASLVGGRANNTDDTAGVCWNCALLDVNVERGDGFADMSSIIRGFGWAVDNGARVINASFEVDSNCAAADMAGLRDAVKEAIDAGVVVVAAAGNKGWDALNTSPASCSGVISVAATDRNKVVAAYSNHTNVTLAAPGGFAAFNGVMPRTGKNIDCADDSYSSFDDNADGVVVNWTTAKGFHCARHLAGTSLAAPQVAGVVGLMLTRNPKLTAAQVQGILQSTAQKVCGSKCGAGLLDATAAVQKAAPLPPPGDSKPLASFTVQCSGLLCTFDGGNSTDNTGIVAYDWILPGEQFRTGKTVSAYMPGYGLKAARLRVTDGYGQAHEVQKNFTHPQPTVNPVVGQYHSVTRPDVRFDLFHTPGDALVLIWHTFDSKGEPIWYSSGTGPRQGARWSQPLYRTDWANGGSALSTTVGWVALDFSTSTDVWLSWQLDDKQGGERFRRQFGGQGRSGVWYMPDMLGWGINVQESSGKLEAAVAFHYNWDGVWRQGWMRSAMLPASSNIETSLTYYTGKGLCPSCGGTTPAAPSIHWSASTKLQIAGGATSGSAAVAVKYDFSYPKWTVPQKTIQILTQP